MTPYRSRQSTVIGRPKAVADGRRPTTNLLCPSCERQQRYISRLLYRYRQSALMRRADPGQAARDNLSALGHELREQAHVFVVDGFDLFRTELADFLATEIFASAFAGTSAGALAARSTVAAFGALGWARIAA